jgi:predicted nucleic acid-binding protein
MAGKATAALSSGETLLLTDLVFAECVYVLRSFYEATPTTVASLMRSALALSSVRVVDKRTLLRALTIFEFEGLHFADAYLAALAEATGVGEILSFDRSIDRLATVERREP